MIVLSEDKKKLVDAGSIFISPVRDRENQDEIISYRVLAKAQTSPKPITVGTFSTEEDAREWLKNLSESLS